MLGSLANSVGRNTIICIYDYNEFYTQPYSKCVYVYVCVCVYPLFVSYTIIGNLFTELHTISSRQTACAGSTHEYCIYLKHHPKWPHSDKWAWCTSICHLWVQIFMNFVMILIWQLCWSIHCHPLVRQSNYTVMNILSWSALTLVQGWACSLSFLTSCHQTDCRTRTILTNVYWQSRTTPSSN